MSSAVWKSLATIALSLILVTAAAQSSPPDATPASRFDRELEQLNVALIQSYISNIDGFTSQDDAQKIKLKQSFQHALQLFRERQKLNSQVTELGAAIEKVPEQLAAIRKQLNQPPEDTKLKLEPNTNLARLLDREKLFTQQLGEKQQELKSLRALLHSLSERKTITVKQVSEDRESVQKTEAELLAQNSDVQSPASEAKRNVLLIERGYLLSRIKFNQIDQEYDNARRDLITAQIDLSRRQINQLESQISQLNQFISQRRRQEAEQVKETNEQLQRLAARQHPLMRKVAAENLRLAELRVRSKSSTQKGLSTIVTKLSEKLTERRQSLNSLEQRIKNATRKVKAAGLTNAIGVFLRRQLEQLPNENEIVTEVRQRQRQLAEYQYQWFLYEDQREQYGDVARRVQTFLESLPKSTSNEERVFLRVVANELYQARRDILDLLINDYQQYFEIAVELNRIDAERLDQIRQFRKYVEERILWVPSVDDQSQFDSRVLREVAALFHPAIWLEATKEVLFSLFTQWYWALIVFVGALTALIMPFVARHNLKVSLSKENLSKPKIVNSLKALFWTGLCASPTAFIVLCFAIVYSFWYETKPIAVRIVCEALFASVLSLYFFGCLRELVRPRQIAERHFNFPKDACYHIIWHLRWFVPLRVGLVFLYALVDSHEVSAHWNDTLGRTAFIVNQGMTALFIFCVFRFSTPVGNYFFGKESTGFQRQFRFIIFGLAVTAPAFLAALSLEGYHYTALRFEENFFNSVLLILAVVVFYALSLRWLSITKFYHEQKLQAIAEEFEHTDSEEELEASETPVHAIPGLEDLEVLVQAKTSGKDVARKINPLLMDPDSMRVTTVKLIEDYEEKVERARSFVRSLIWLTLLLGMVGIWSAMVPAFKQLDRYQIYPDLRRLDITKNQTNATTLPLTRNTTELDPNTAQPDKNDIADHITVTLADLLFASIIAIFTIILASNLPALTDIALLRYLPIDSGGRYAIAALTQYIILAVGASLAFSSLGLRWRSIQWLAAALTFGLAFGLQEIFANFISGLIILFERPIRVGDVVTVGDVSGVVTRIQIRATTIRNFERKELIIPNKAFVTDRVLNWVLTDSVIRILIPVGVAYGSDVKKTRRILQRIMRRHEEILTEPSPAVLFLGFGPHSLNFEVRGFVSSPAIILDVQHEICVKIVEEFQRHKIEIALPQLDLHFRDTINTKAYIESQRVSGDSGSLSGDQGM